MKRMWTRLQDFVIERPIVDYLVATILVSSHYLAWASTGQGDVIGKIDASNRHDLYGFGGAIIAIIFSGSAAAIAHYASASGQRAEQVKRRWGANLRRQWMGTLVVPGFASAACLLAMALDLSGKSSPAGRWIFEAAVALTLVRFLRAMVLFQIMLDVTDLDRTDRPRRPLPPGVPSRRSRDQRLGV